MRRVSRREILRLAGTGVLATGVARVFAFRGASAAVPRSVAARVPRRGSVAEIGRRYVELTPGESTRATLGPLLPQGAVDGSGAVVWSVVAASTSDDYATGDVVTIDGWRFARSEARAAAFQVAAR